MPKYRTAFISHAHEDNEKCKSIYDELVKSYGIDVWIDLTNNQQGYDLGETIGHELRKRSAFLLMVSEESNGSHWVRQELGIYNHLKNSHSTHYVNGVERMILPVRLNDDVPTMFENVFWIETLNRTPVQVAYEIAAALVIEDPPPPESPNSSDATPSGAIAPAPTTATSTKATPSKSQKGGGQLWSILLLIFVFAIVLYLTYALVNLFAVH